jgi:protein-S-isoprenylcysteine O-methyltransferase Ste14
MSALRLFKETRKHLDGIEQVAVLAVYVWFIARLWPGSFAQLDFYLALLIVSESIVVFMTLIRKSAANISNRFSEWFIAFASALFPLLVTPTGELLMPKFGVMLLLWGLAIHLGAKLSLLRSFGIVPANRGIKVKGLYAFVRHPMYAGYFLTHLGFFIAAPSGWNFCVYICCWGLFLARIFAEENLLLRSPEYRAYKMRVPYRIVPGIF